MAAEEVPSRANSWSRDLLRRFAGETPAADAAAGGGGEVELSLGLSMGGRFGAEPKEKRLGLVRSSSIASLSMFTDERAAATQLVRTCSLPSETEEERRRRKEMQSLKRMEAKRKRTEKRAAAAAKERKDDIFEATAGGGVAAGVRPGSQASIGSQGSSASAILDFDCKAIQGNSTEGGSPSTRSSPSDQPNQKVSMVPPSSPAVKPENASREEDEPSRKKTCTAAARPNGMKETGRKVMEEMPCVSTSFEGLGGRRVEGFLYKYKKGEEVRIVCVCHGSFLTPAEFVKHAGGGDVPNPLRHIVVSQTPAFL